MTELVGYMTLFVALAIFFVFIHLVAGRFIRPVRPDPEKLTIYECGEPTIGSSWIQFDLRFYVVALLFVIFDVEVAFFFPWAVVFGRVNALASQNAPQAPEEQKRYNEAVTALVPNYPENRKTLEPYQDEERLLEPKQADANRLNAKAFGWLAFWDLMVFFGVLLVGFAYLWKRGDLDWVRSMAAERAAAGPVEAAPISKSEPAPVGTMKEVQHV
jgi:NADH-quinone oxidoreductase subunit A